MDAIVPQWARLLFHNRPSLVVIASAAKQSTLAIMDASWIASRSMSSDANATNRSLAMTVKHISAFSRRETPEFA